MLEGTEMRILTRIVFLFVLPAMMATAAPDIEVHKSTNNEFPIVTEAQLQTGITNAPTADFIADRSSLRLVVRVILAPIVFTIENPVLASLLFLAFIGAICGWRRSLHAPG